MYQFMMYPPILNYSSEPPTIYKILNSIVNYENPNPVKISELAKNGRSAIFDFDYPLTNNITKEAFEVMILNKFMMRRIGFQTVTAFKLQLNVTLNEIMPLYNKLFDSLEGWNLFNDAEQVTREVIDNRQSDTKATINTNATSNDTQDLRYSELPQNQIENVKNGSYLTTYNYNKDDTTNITKSDNTSNTKDKVETSETIKRTPSDKIYIYKEFLNNKQNIYTMIFKDLESLFYQLV